MSGQVWPDDRARAWLLTTVAGLLKDGGLEDEAQELARHAMSLSAGWQREDGFRRLLADALCWKEEQIDRAVAEVYGEATAATRPRLPGCPGIDSASALACCGRVDCSHLDAASHTPESPTTLQPAEHVAEEWIAAESTSLLGIDYRAVRASLAGLIDRSRAEGAAAGSVDAALIAALRAEEAHDANPHAASSDDPLATRLYNHGVRAAELAQHGARYVAERLFALAERSHAETKQLRARVAALEAAPSDSTLSEVVAAYRQLEETASGVSADRELGRAVFRLGRALEAIGGELRAAKAGGQPR